MSPCNCVAGALAKHDTLVLIVLGIALLLAIAARWSRGAPADSDSTASSDKRLENLLTYTIFHIGVYLSLTTAFIGASVLKSIDHPLLRWAALCFMIAGAFGGLIAANAAEYRATPNEFFKSTYRLDLWGSRSVPYWVAAMIEHMAFWFGIVPIVVLFVFCGTAGFPGPAGG